MYLGDRSELSMKMVQGYGLFQHPNLIRLLGENPQGNNLSIHWRIILK
jgi:hypothetical protein